LAAAAAALQIPELANVFYYGKEFGSQDPSEGYRPLSVTIPGAMGEVVEQKKTEENTPQDPVDALLAKQSEQQMTIEDLINMLRGSENG
jgi:hypothetical protein